MQNPFSFSDPRAQALSDKWVPLYHAATNKQKAAIGRLFLTRVLGVSEATVDEFLTGPTSEAFSIVGSKQSSIPVDVDTQSFWQEVANIFPGDLSAKDLEFLIEEGQIFAVFHFLTHLDHPGSPTSSVMSLIDVNAHAYK